MPLKSGRLWKNPMKEPKREKRFFIDTNIFLRALVKENQTDFDNCVRFLRLISDGKIQTFTSTIILLEVNFVLISFYNFEKPRIYQALQSIIDLPGLKFIDDFNRREAIELYAKTGIKFTDCLLASLIKDSNLTIVSYDHDFDKLGLRRLEPKEILTDNA